MERRAAIRGVTLAFGVQVPEPIKARCPPLPQQTDKWHQWHRPACDISQACVYKSVNLVRTVGDGVHHEGKGTNAKWREKVRESTQKKRRLTRQCVDYIQQTAENSTWVDSLKDLQILPSSVEA